MSGCDQTAQGAVVTASLAVRENEISKETDKQEIGAMCLACGHKEGRATEPGVARHFPPTEWHAANTIDPSTLKTAFVEMLGRASRD
jgi:hypothetical protein